MEEDEKLSILRNSIGWLVIALIYQISGFPIFIKQTKKKR